MGTDYTISSDHRGFHNTSFDCKYFRIFQFTSLKVMIRVAVIGAGGAGLCMARYLADQPSVFNTVIYEQTNNVGGTWVYTDKTDIDEHGLPIHSSMYKNLRY